MLRVENTVKKVPLPAGKLRCLDRSSFSPFATFMNQAAPATPVTDRAKRIRMRQIERRQWWLWASAIVVTLLLTAGVASFAFPLLYAHADSFYFFHLR